MKYLFDRAQEASTWRGLILALTGIMGVTVSPELIEQVIIVGVGAAGLVGMLTKDK